MRPSLHPLAVAAASLAWAFLSPTGQVPDTLPAAVDPAAVDTLPAEEVEPLPPGALSPEELERALALRAPIVELMAIYRRMDGLRNVEVHLDEGILELSGVALSGEERDRAAELAREIAGIRWVDNRIQVERSVARRLAPAMERFEEKGIAFVRFLPVLLVGMLILGLTTLVAIWAGRPSFPYDRITSNSFAADFLRMGVRLVILLVGTLLALDLMGAGALVGAVLGTAGLAGLAVGFAFRDIVENYLAGILLSLRQPFAPRDHVELSGQEGRVVRLTGRETVLMTLDGNHVRIPNSTVFKSVMTNYTRNPRRRFLVRVGVAPWEDLSRALRVGKEVLTGMRGVLENPSVSARVHELGDSSVELRFFAWMDQTESDFGKVRSEAMRKLKEAFEEEGIHTPPPEYGVRILDGAEREGGPPKIGVGAGETTETPVPGRAGDAAPRGEQAEEAAPAPPPTPRVVTEPGAAEPEPEPDLSPDRTIEEAIEQELEESGEDNLLKPQGGSD
jgi:small conductance mechanosensitive channel